MELACPSQKETHKTTGIYPYLQRAITNIKINNPIGRVGLACPWRRKSTRPEGFTLTSEET